MPKVMQATIMQVRAMADLKSRGKVPEENLGHRPEYRWTATGTDGTWKPVPGFEAFNFTRKVALARAEDYLEREGARAPGKPMKPLKRGPAHRDQAAHKALDAYIEWANDPKQDLIGISLIEAMTELAEAYGRDHEILP